MPMVYEISLATPGVLTTSGTTNTEVDAWFIKAGVRNVYLTSVRVQGKANAATTISGISFRVMRLTTASTGGTGITPAPRDLGMQASKATSASRPAIGSTRTNHVIFGCGKAGPGGWVAETPDHKLVLEGGGAFSIDMVDVATEISLTYEFSASFEE
jgi:hypothetical protein